MDGEHGLTDQALVAARVEPIAIDVGRAGRDADRLQPVRRRKRRPTGTPDRAAYRARRRRRSSRSDRRRRRTRCRCARRRRRAVTMPKSRRSARAAQLGPLIVDLEVRVLALRDAERSQHARQRPASKRPLRFERRALGCAPRERDRQALAQAQRIDGARAPAIRPAIPVVVGEDRQEHQPAGETPERARARCRPDERRAARGRAGRARPGPSPACDSVSVPRCRRSGRSPAADARSRSARLARACLRRATPASRDHVIVGHRGVAMNADFGDGLDDWRGAWLDGA